MLIALFVSPTLDNHQIYQLKLNIIMIYKFLLLLTIALYFVCTGSIVVDAYKLAIFGATGALGKSTLQSLMMIERDINVVLMGRSKDKLINVIHGFDTDVMKRLNYSVVDIDTVSSKHLSSIFKEQNIKLAFNAIGPFHGQRPIIVESSIEAGINYLDACDDINGFAIPVREQFNKKAKEMKSTAVITGGVFPGLSNIIAAKLVHLGGGAKEVRFRYFMAGTNGFGESVMISSMMGSITPATEYVNRKKILHDPFDITQKENVDFGKIIGKRNVYPFELPETTSIHIALDVPSVSAKFGTAPDIFNLLSWFTGQAMTTLLESSHTLFSLYVSFCFMISSIVDRFVGKAFGMEIAVVGNDGKTRTLLSTCEDGVRATGIVTSWQLSAMIHADKDKLPKGVLFPEEAIIGDAREKIHQLLKDLSIDYDYKESDKDEKIDIPSKLENILTVMKLISFMLWPAPLIMMAMRNQKIKKD